jgi:hypothetical protein
MLITMQHGMGMEDSAHLPHRRDVNQQQHAGFLDLRVVVTDSCRCDRVACQVSQD